MPRVYVGNLASSVTSRALHEHFSRAGGVIGALAVSDKASGLCRGSSEQRTRADSRAG